MKQCENIDSIISYMLTHHKFISQSKGGGYGLVLLRKHNGSRIIIQEMKYFRIFSYKIMNENSVIIQNIITGFSFKGNHKQSASSSLFLHDLVQINVYDHSSHFISRSGVDFAYLEENQSASMQALQEFIHESPRAVRATWTDQNTAEDDMLDAITFGRRRAVADPYRRNIAVDRGTI